MDSVISRMISCIAALRPLRSAYRPSRTPPTGRMKKPTPKVARAISSEVYSSPEGKNSLAIRLERKP
ncbi:Uncharacterised protein [Acinetobacter baumannii]|nr:Uncharacterised protein [Acinetobacter baumannii]